MLQWSNMAHYEHGNIVPGFKSGHFNRRHGFASGPKQERIYYVWKLIKQRCLNPNRPDFKHYGGRGIELCERWQRFENFLADMGLPPTTGHSIDRIDNNIGYFQANCRWATRVQQCNNRRSNRIIEFCGKKLTIREWESKLGFKEGTLWWRINNGWPLERAFTKKPYTQL